MGVVIAIERWGYVTPTRVRWVAVDVGVVVKVGLVLRWA